jgi:hypothetical protein
MKGWTQADVDAYRSRQAAGGVVVAPADPQKPAQRQARWQGGPNKTEAACVKLFPGEFAFEGRTFDICGGARYTPDWVDEAAMVAVESKGEFLHSRDSRRRFDEAKHLYPGWTWIWARLRSSGRKGPRWEVEIYARRIG